MLAKKQKQNSNKIKYRVVSNDGFETQKIIRKPKSKQFYFSETTVKGLCDFVCSNPLAEETFV